MVGSNAGEGGAAWLAFQTVDVAGSEDASRLGSQGR